jgi:hypothetical protein
MANDTRRSFPPKAGSRGRGPAGRDGVKAALALSERFAVGEKLGVADLGRPNFEILGGLVVILSQ